EIGPGTAVSPEPLACDDEGPEVLARLERAEIKNVSRARGVAAPRLFGRGPVGRGREFPADAVGDDANSGSGFRIEFEQLSRSRVGDADQTGGSFRRPFPK